jgi:hypothetical protein
MKNLSQLLGDIHIDWLNVRFRQLFLRTQRLGLPARAMSLDAQRRLNELNLRRRDAQRSMSAVLSTYQALCQSCGGLCCMGHESFFRVTDYLVRLYSDSPLDSFAKERNDQFTLRWLYTRSIRFLRPRKAGYDYLGSRQWVRRRSHCPELTKSGCRVDPAERPISCIIWTCPPLWKQIGSEDRLRCLGIIRRLYAISCATLQVAKFEARTNGEDGSFRLNH